MKEIGDILREIFSDDIYRCIFSDVAKPDNQYEKIVIRSQGEAFQSEKYTKKQAFHENIASGEILEYARVLLGESFKQLNAWSKSFEYSMRISKKGKILYSRRAISSGAPKEELRHNREKNYIIKQGDVAPPLVDMGVMTREGNVISAMYSKFRQINRFLEIIDDEVKNLDVDRPLSIIDLCCGKSYLTFVLYHYLTNIKGMRVQMLGLDLKADVIERCNETAQKYGYSQLSFKAADINQYQHDNRPDMVIALHACDIATDYVLYNAIRWNARLIFSVPCCQHELNAQIESGEYGILTRYGIIKERVAALMTDSIRANLLQCCGYHTQLLEFIDMEHTPKNILIRAVKSGRAEDREALGEIEALMAQFHLQPTLYRLLKDAGLLRP